MGDFTWCVKRGLEWRKIRELGAGGPFFSTLALVLLLIFLALEALAEIFQALAEGTADLRKAACPKNDQNHDEKEDDLPGTQT
jgi:hypothetical protein